MPPIDQAPQPSPAEAEKPDQFQQFQIDLATSLGNYVIAASDTVNDLVAQAKLWLGTSSAAQSLTDGKVISITLQELDPATGAYVDGEEIPVEDKDDIIRQIRLLGAR